MCRTICIRSDSTDLVMSLLSSLHNVRENAEGHLPIENQVHPFETDLFEGKILVRLRSHPDAAR